MATSARRKTSISSWLATLRIRLESGRPSKRCLTKRFSKLGDDDIRDYTVVRVSDEILVDLMISACGIAYGEAKASIETVEIHGVPIPFANAELLLRMKQTHREKDADDRVFLRRKIAARKGGQVKGDLSGQ